MAIRAAVENKELSIEEANEIILKQKKSANRKQIKMAKASKEDFKLLYN
jgi:hypothetical protein